MVEIKKINKEMLGRYSEIPISFEVKSILKMDLINNGLDGIKFLEEKVPKPFYMNFDEDGHGPESWPTRFNIDNWGIFVAIKDEIYVGGMALAYQTPNVNMLEGKNDISVLWDIRVLPEYRGFGVGSMLFEQAVNWSKERSCKRIKIETQNTNINACRFYKKQGCKLGNINQYAYGDLSEEIMMIWYYAL